MWVFVCCGCCCMAIVSLYIETEREKGNSLNFKNFESIRWDLHWIELIEKRILYLKLVLFSLNRMNESIFLSNLYNIFCFIYFFFLCTLITTKIINEKRTKIWLICFEFCCWHCFFNFIEENKMVLYITLMKIKREKNKQNWTKPK